MIEPAALERSSASNNQQLGFTTEVVKGRTPENSENGLDEA